MENVRTGQSGCRINRDREDFNAVTITLSGTTVSFTLCIFFISIFTSVAWTHPEPRLPAGEGPAGNGGTAVASCGAVTTSPRGVLQTPGFPKAFPVPLRCTWVIDASTGHAPGSSILVRLTQVFVARGLRFESFTRLDVTPASDGRPWRFLGGHRTGRVPSDGRQLIFDSDFGSSTPLEEVAWIRSASPYLVATLTIDTLEGSHIRDLGVLLDVYGLNMTYEVLPPPSANVSSKESGALGGRRRQEGRRRGDKARDQGLDGGCSLLGCSVAGHCLANHDLSRYHCSCFEGHFGRRCQYSRECNPMKNISRCLNGGKCRHVGSAAIRCQCPKGFYGALCESRHPIIGARNHNSQAGRKYPEKRIEVEMKVSAATIEKKGCPNCQGFQCKYNDAPESVCQCQNGYKVNDGDRWLFEGKFKIANFTVRTPAFPNVTLEELLEKQLTAFLKRQNVTGEPSVSIENVSEDGEVSYSFRVGKDDDPKVREALNVLVKEMQYLGELPISPDLLEVHQEPALLLLDVALDRESVLPGGEYMASCVAQGSPAMEFRWYKDGYLIDHTKASRHMWQRLLLDDRPNTYTAILRVTAVSASEDMGVLWCHVSDQGRQQCGHVLLVEARGPHQEVFVRPRASTILRGGNLTLACTSHSSITVGAVSRAAEFIWRKNGSPLDVTFGKEVVEPLYPYGSLLRVHKAQKSAEYTCHIATNISSQQRSDHLKQPKEPLSWEVKNSHSSHVAVVDPGDPFCPQETSWGVVWPYTAVGQRAAVECPVAHLSSPPTSLNDHVDISNPPDSNTWGHIPIKNVWVPLRGSEATRLCGGGDKWEVPDFSLCYCHPVSFLLKKFQRLTLGYLTTSPEVTLQEILDWLMSAEDWNIPKNSSSSDGPRLPVGSQSFKSPILLPGQIRQFHQLLEEVQCYLYNRMVIKDNYPGDIDMHISSYNLLKVLDLLLLKHQDLVSDPQVSSHLIRLASKQSTLWGYSLSMELSEFSVQYPIGSSNVTISGPATTSNSLFVHMESVTDGRVTIPRTGVSIPAWFSEQVEVSLLARAPREPVNRLTDGLSKNMSSNPEATSSTQEEPPKNVLISIIAFRNIGNNIPIKNQNRYDHMEYQLASHVVSIGVYHRYGQEIRKSSITSSLKKSRDLKEWHASLRAEMPLNITIHFSIELQGIPEQFQNGNQNLVACGQLKDGQIAITTELTSSWDVGMPHSPLDSVVACHFENSGIYGAFITAQKLKHQAPSSHSSPIYMDSERRMSSDDEWWEILNSGPGSGGKTILTIGFGICIALCLLTVFRNIIATILTWREEQEKSPEEIPPVGRSSSSEQHVSDEAFDHSHVVTSKKIIAKSDGQSISVEFYLQLQCCIAVLILMGLFSYCCLILSPQSSFLAMTLGLEGFMLTGMTSLMGVVLILYCDVLVESKVTEVVPQTSMACISMMCVRSRGAQSITADPSSVTQSKRDSSLQVRQLSCCKITKFQSLLKSKLIIAGITSGVPMLSVLLCDLSRRIFNSRKQSSWWLTVESPHFAIFLSLAIIISLAFLPVSVYMLWQLEKIQIRKERKVEEVMLGKEAEANSISSMRIEVLRRALIIFSLMATMEIASIIYINFPDSSVAHWVFSISSICLGMAIFLSYAIEFDEPIKLCNYLMSLILSHARDRR